ncbi:MAG: hypothetical protein ABSE73_00870 [Planctomycetota bacterium]
MRITGVALAVSMLLASGRVFAFGIDVGPVHVHGTDVKVGDSTTLKIVVDKLKYEEKGDTKILKEIKAHRKGDSDDTFVIKVDKDDLNDSSKEVLAKIKEDTRYKMTIKKIDDGWRLEKIKLDEDD